MIIPVFHYPAPNTGEVAAMMSMSTRVQSSIHPTSRRTETISYLLPVAIIAAFLLIMALIGLLARWLYKRFKTLRMTSSPSGSPWKSYRSSALSGSNNSLGNTYDDQDFDENGPGEHERLLARRRSTSYYDANRSRAPVAVVIKHDSKGRPISTWSTASSVAAQRGEELSQWSKRRDDLIKIYGRSNLNSSSFANDDLEEEPEQEREQEQEEEEHHSNQGQGQWLDPVLASDQSKANTIVVNEIESSQLHE